jgi:alkanesulfonate monooxygenase SsuD/methylene tetrahydromethanopterin reductase-like flavin-dependent oxidoreductase (luciferase family)
MGMPKGRPLAKLTETIDLLEQWFRPPFSATSPPDATEFHFDAWRRVIHPLQSHLPVYLAAVGPKALGVAARYADGVIFNDLASRTFIRESIQRIREDATAAGRDASRLHFYVRAAFTITDNPEAAYEQRKSTVAMIHTLPGMEKLLETPGFETDRIISDVRKVMHTEEILARGGGFPDLRDGGDLAAARKLIPTALMRELTIAGTVPEVRKRLQELREIGVTHVFLTKPKANATVESVAEMIAAVS